VIGSATELGITWWLRLFGRPVAKRQAPWLASPTGANRRIGEELYSRLADKENLVIAQEQQAGLIADFEALRGSEFDPRRIRPQIRHFYEHTSLYLLESWSEAPLLTRFFLWFLVKFVSRRMDQLNFPISSLELSRGMTSSILQLREKRSNRTMYTGWLRKCAANGCVVYAGFYSAGRVSSTTDPCMKVCFPVPRGSSVVFLRPQAQMDGSLKLISRGSRFGDYGFYRVLAVDDERWKVRYLRTLHELFHMYVDEHGILRTDHVIRFLGFTVIRLHYKMTLKADVPQAQRVANNRQADSKRYEREHVGTAVDNRDPRAPEEWPTTPKYDRRGQDELDPVQKLFINKMESGPEYHWSHVQNEQHHARDQAEPEPSAQADQFRIGACLQCHHTRAIPHLGQLPAWSLTSHGHRQPDGGAGGGA
jgi:hypothetical protein